MKFARKYYLVNQQQFEKLNQDEAEESAKDILEHPNEKGAKVEHDRMKKILSNDHLTDYEKVIGYSQSLQKYLNDMRDSLVVPKSKAILGNKQTFIVPQPKEEQSENFAMLEKDKTDFPSDIKKDNNEPNFNAGNILSEFNSEEHRKKVETMLQAIAQSPVISWNENDGHVKIHGRKFHNSNISKLLKTAVGIKAVDQRSREWIKFRQVLTSLGLISRSKPSSQIGKGLNSPPLRLSVARKWHCLKD